MAWPQRQPEVAVLVGLEGSNDTISLLYFEGCV